MENKRTQAMISEFQGFSQKNLASFLLSYDDSKQRNSISQTFLPCVIIKSCQEIAKNETGSSANRVQRKIKLCICVSSEKYLLEIV